MILTWGPYYYKYNSIANEVIMIWTGTNEVMDLIIQHEYYRELLATKSQVRETEADAPEAQRTEEKVY
jgi:hypothetical protein